MTSRNKRPRTTSDSPQANTVVEIDPTPQKIRLAELHPGSYITTINQYRILALQDGMRGQEVRLIDADGLQLTVSSSIIQAESIAASQFTTRKVVTMTDMERIFKDIGPGFVFTVRFVKKADVAQSFESFRAWFQENPELLQKSFDDYDRKNKTSARKAYTASSTGPVRILTGYKKTSSGHSSAEDVLGRAKVVDLHLANPGVDDPVSVRDKAHPERLVDYRAIKELIVNDTHYLLKGEKAMLTESGKAY